MEGVKGGIIYENLIFSKFITNYLTEFPMSDSVCKCSTMLKKELHKFFEENLSVVTGTFLPIELNPVTIMKIA
jgi:hypothetical protein